MANSIISTNNSYENIKNGFKKLYSKEFKDILINTKNPYGDGCASGKIIKVLKNIDLENILKKSFYDIAVD
jgi:GDP/UDP-N,N'-diacetylbacillosamine 2-epimerase (hydrolysing)